MGGFYKKKYFIKKKIALCNVKWDFKKKSYSKYNVIPLFKKKVKLSTKIIKSFAAKISFVELEEKKFFLFKVQFIFPYQRSFFRGSRN